MRSRVFALCCAIVVLVLAFAVAHVSMRRPINGDEAYNMQIAKSIGLRFCYCTRYRPERVFPVEGSTNGVLQYAGGLFFAFADNPDVAKVGTITLAVLLLGIALLVLDPWLVLIAALLFLLWPTFVHVAIAFYGEIWAIAFSLLGIAVLRNGETGASFRRLLTSRTVVVASVCFGLAIESKLVAVITVIPLIWAAAYARGTATDRLARVRHASSVTATVGAGMVLTLLLSVAFSVIHSMRSVNVGTIWQTFTGFIFNMVGQGQGQAQPFDMAHVGQMLSQFDSPTVLVLVALSAAILLYANWAYAFFLVSTLVWWLHYGVNERHLVIALFLTIVLAGLEGHAILRRIADERSLSHTKLSLGAAATLAAVVAIAGLTMHGTFDAPGTIVDFPQRERVIQTSLGRLRYSAQLVDLLRRQQYVVTSGWWQFSELTLRENLEFYDRMSPANAGLARERVALMFDTGNDAWPLTSVAGNCERILHTEGAIVVCAVKRRIPLSFQQPSKQR